MGLESDYGENLEGQTCGGRISTPKDYLWQLNTVNTQPPPCLFFDPSTRNFRAKAVYMVLGSS